MAKPKQFGCFSGCAIIVGLGFVVSIGVVVFGVKPPSGRPVAVQAQPAATKEELVGQPFDIRVKSVIVKKVGGKFRYFFDVRNHDDKPFAGNVKITLVNRQRDVSNGDETFEATTPIQPEIGKSVFIEANTGPIGEWSVGSFRFVAKLNGQKVAEGSGEITTKSE